MFVFILSYYEVDQAIYFKQLADTLAKSSKTIESLADLQQFTLEKNLAGFRNEKNMCRTNWLKQIFTYRDNKDGRFKTKIIGQWIKKMASAKPKQKQMSLSQLDQQIDSKDDNAHNNNAYYNDDNDYNDDEDFSLLGHNPLSYLFTTSFYYIFLPYLCTISFYYIFFFFLYLFH